MIGPLPYGTVQKSCQWPLWRFCILPHASTALEASCCEWFNILASTVLCEFPARKLQGHLPTFPRGEVAVKHHIRPDCKTFYALPCLIKERSTDSRICEVRWSWATIPHLEFTTLNQAGLNYTHEDVRRSKDTLAETTLC